MINVNMILNRDLYKIYNIIFNKIYPEQIIVNSYIECSPITFDFIANDVFFDIIQSKFESLNE